MIVIEARSGLGNKLRVVFSYWEHAKVNNKNLIVIWKESDECPGFFLDFFEPVNGITFLRENSENLKLDYRGNEWHSDFNPYEKFIYSDLNLQSRLQDRVNKTVNELEEFIAIQVRRTDHEKLAKEKNKFTTDEDFCKFIDNNPRGNLFITADNKKSFDFFRERYPDRVKIDYPKNDPTKLRHTSLEDSIIDMFICTHATAFKRSDWSSFGGTILQLRMH
jgi:hypothetical protein